MAGLRRIALHRLMEHQQLDPFKFLIYAELAGASSARPSDRAAHAGAGPSGHNTD